MNQASLNAYKRAWAKANPDKVIAANKKWAANNKEKIKIKSEIYASKNPNKKRESSKRRNERIKRELPLFLIRVYGNMLNRVRGKLKNTPQYMGLPLLDKVSFMDWALNDKELIQLFKVWNISKHNTKLTPSIDRKDVTKGYIIDNMRWLTKSENSKEMLARRWFNHTKVSENPNYRKILRERKRCNNESL